jgi:predicted RNA-binding protein with PIN domain
MVMASGAERVPVRELIQDMEAVVKKFRDDKKKSVEKQGLKLSDFMDAETLDQFNKMRVKE